MIDDCANAYKNNYNFSELLQFMASQPWFYKAEYIGNKVKTPVELLIQFQHQTGLRTYGLMCHTHLQRLLGQQLFNPPSVGGWPDGKNWLNGTILIARLSIPNQLIKISNRSFPKKGASYKLFSWMSGFSIRHFRWQMDAKFDQDAYNIALEKHKLSEAFWLLGGKSTSLSQEQMESLRLKQILQHPFYQYC